MGGKELSSRAVEGFMRERAEAWHLVNENVDPETGFLPISIIDSLLSSGGIGTIVANDAMHLVDPAVLKRAVILEEKESEREQ